MRPRNDSRPQKDGKYIEKGPIKEPWRFPH